MKTSNKLLETREGFMTHEQVGKICVLADELGKFDELFLNYIQRTRRYEEAEEHISKLCRMIDKK
jgi:hypothetical protein